MKTPVYKRTGPCKSLVKFLLQEQELLDLEKKNDLKTCQLYVLC